MLKLALASAQAATYSDDKAAFVVAVRVAQAQLNKRLDLVRLLDACIDDFPDCKQFLQAFDAISKEAEPIERRA